MAREVITSAAPAFVTREGVDAFWSRMEAQHGLRGCVTFPGFLARTALRFPDKTALAAPGDVSFLRAFNAADDAAVPPAR